jgi:predicted HicB family RNase H-like nuclease
MDRINLRLPPETFRAIDALRERRAGSVSRNTWIAEAITEKLARGANEPFAHSKERAKNA